MPNAQISMFNVKLLKIANCKLLIELTIGGM